MQWHISSNAIINKTSDKQDETVMSVNLKYILTWNIPHHTETLLIYYKTERKFWEKYGEDDYIPHVDQLGELLGHYQKQLLHAKALVEAVDV